MRKKHIRCFQLEERENVSYCASEVCIFSFSQLHSANINIISELELEKKFPQDDEKMHISCKNKKGKFKVEINFMCK